MIPSLADTLLDAGLIQFGLFNGMPFQLNLKWLPSYPDILKQIIQALVQQIEFSAYERLLCENSALPLGVGLSMHTEIPLVYSLGTTFAGVHDLVGAYDVGHSTLLILNIRDGSGEADRLIDAARLVGLNIDTVASVVAYQNCKETNIQHVNLLDLATLTAQLAQACQIPLPQAEAVQRWIESNASSPHLA
jgi:orotate phosphoribosyltransferase